MQQIASRRSESASASAKISLAAKVAVLRSPRTYGAGCTTVEAIETHFAWVFLSGTLAFKLKKPLRNEYVDLTDLSARRWLCEEEVRLNRRLAPDVYLDVCPLALSADGSLQIGGSGAVVDWLVAMRRLPQALMLDRMIAAHATSQAALTAVGLLLTQFYASQCRIDFEAEQYIRRIGTHLKADEEALSAQDLQLSATLVRSTTAQLRNAFAHMRSELAQRAAEGRIVEAHGDLRPEHICLSNPPCVIDALEFSLDLRTLDPGEELAFLCLECARTGGESAGEKILDTYLRHSADPISARLLQFYRSRRALVRAKLAAWHLRDPQFRDVAPWREQAHSYLQLATFCARQAVC